MPAYSALIDFSHPRQPEAARWRWAFTHPREHYIAHQVHEVRSVLDAVQAAARRGQWCVGYVAYEAAPAFDSALQVHAAPGPLAWFATYDQALPWPQNITNTLASHMTMPVDWKVPVQRADLQLAMERIHHAITRGEVYQVNFTAQMQGLFAEHNEALDAHAYAALARGSFFALQRAQPGGYAAYIHAAPHTHLLSVSPELFFDWREGSILTRPMKGTAARGDTPDEDTARAWELKNSIKERAENVMVVDMLRNDLSRIAQPLSVRVPRLFHTQALSTVWQMSSDIEALTRAGCSLGDIFAALFPCGSVTGAPKVQAMRTIAELESEPRGVYCGAIGIVQPGGAATFNVPIRTVTLQNQHARCGIGSGITLDANLQGEWREWQHKQRFVQRASTEFSLLETLALVEGVFPQEQAHLQRMQHAAVHFAYPWPQAHIQEALTRLRQAHSQGRWRVRLLLNAHGQFQAQAYVLEPNPARVRLRLAQQPLAQTQSEFVRFKTTHRAHYDSFTPVQTDVFDTVLWNTEGEVTECTRGNIALLLNGAWVTPPLQCGLLSGIGRAQVLRAGRVQEAVVRVDDWQKIQGLAFINSLRGWIDADKAKD